MTWSIADVNNRVAAGGGGWAWNRATGMAELYNLTKPGFRTYFLGDYPGYTGYDGYYYFRRDNNGYNSWDYSNTGSVFMTTNDSSACGGTYEGAYTYIAKYTLNCVANNTNTSSAGNNCNCVNACGNCYSHPYYEQPISVNEWNGTSITYGSGQCTAYYQCAQCAAPTGNCDTQGWLQPNCNCMNCACACNCMNSGQCTTITL